VQKKIKIVLMNYKIIIMVKETTLFLSFPIKYCYKKNIINTFFAPLETETPETFLTSLHKFE